MAHFVLVHGAWHAAWCWQKLIPLLEAKGHTVTAPDLPGHGADGRPKSSATLAHYVDHVAAVIAAAAEPVILTGHSLAGVTISQVGEQIPEKLQYLVYVAAFLVRDGESAATYGFRDAESLVPPNIEMDAEGLGWFRPAAARDAFYGRCSRGDAEWAIQRLEAQNLEPVNASLSLSPERFGRVPKAYVVCTEDRAATVDVQRTMLENWACDPVFEIETDHSPFLSTPEELAVDLDSVARRESENER